MMGFCDPGSDGLALELAGGRDQLFRDPPQVVAFDIKDMTRALRRKGKVLF